jgi:amino acid transporter
MQLRRALGLIDLTLFNIAAVVGIRWLAAAAHAGPGSLSLWIAAATLFFVPCALAVASLSGRFPEQGGIYVWTQRAFGDWHGFLCGYCYWLSNLFYFPNLIVAGVGMAAAAFGWGDTHVVTVSLVMLWILLVMNLLGFSIGKWIGNAGGVATYSAGAVLIAAGAAVFFWRGPATPLQLAPDLSMEKLNFWSQIAFAFGGLELGAVMAGEIRDPQRTIPRAAWLSGLAIAAFYLLGTLAMLILLPSAEVNVITGLVQAGNAAAAQLGLGGLGVMLSMLVCVSVAGQAGSWIAGAARIPYVIGIDHLLPESFARTHPRWGTPYVSILTQGVASTAFLVILHAGENLKAGYQILVDMTVILYFIPFAYLFASAWRFGQRLAAMSGMFVTLVALVVSVIPPPGIASLAIFEFKLIGGAAALMLVARWWFQRASRRWEREPCGAEPAA